MAMSDTMFDELYCKVCGAPLSVDEMEDGTEMCDSCTEEMQEKEESDG